MTKTYLYQGSLVLTISAGETITTGTQFRLRYLNPNGVYGYFNGTLSGTTSVTRQFANEDLDVVGLWRFQAYAEVSGRSVFGAAWEEVLVQESLTDSLPIFVTLADFDVRPYRIPNQDENLDLAQWLKAKESDIMESLLGWDLWEEFQAGLAVDYPSDKWEELRDGLEYSYAGETWKYKGVNDFIVPALYAYWLRDTFDRHTATGIGINTKDNFTSISPAERISRAFNVFARKVGNVEEYRNTLWGFLSARYEANYTSWDPERDFNPPGRMNIFNI